jgi:alkanesulfonate monooxygenase SsuD/methylene tetrahydromethanopterin reductase-like flavin-dependent oxidoreductase (luciferase family)
LIGGHSEPALRRAARLGDGWMHAGSDQETLDRLLARLKELRTEYGRDRDPFEIHIISIDAYSPDGVRRLEEAGISDVIVGFRDVYAGQDMPLAQKVDALRRYADDVIVKTRG